NPRREVATHIRFGIFRPIIDYNHFVPMFRDALGGEALQGCRQHRSAVKRRNYDTDQWALGSAASTRWRSSFGRPGHSPGLSSILNSRWKFFSAFQKSSLRKSSLSTLQNWILYYM